MRSIDVVHHNAALNPLTKAGKKFWQVNVEGSGVIAEAASRGGVKCFIHTSSSAVFGGVLNSPITNTTPPKPIESYGKTKLAGELLVARICQQNELPLITIRPRAILGAGRLGIFRILFDWIDQGKTIYVIGSGNQQFQFIHPIDLLNAYMLALNLGRPGTYNVGTHEYGTLRQALENLISYAGSRSKVKSIPPWLAISTLRVLDKLGLSPLAPFHYLTYHKEIFFDVTPLLDLGWRPQYSNDDMFRESYEWFKRHRGEGSGAVGSVHRLPTKEKLLWLLRKFS
jgi:nucleoside-diphosphate-sugar epimerase